MLTPEQIRQMRAEVGIPEGGYGSVPQVSAEERISKLRTGAEKIKQQNSPNQTGNFLTSPTLPYRSNEGGASVAGKAVVNAPSSGARLATNVIKSIANIFNPFEDISKGDFRITGKQNTLANVAKLGAGAIEKGVSALSGKEIESEETRIADQVGQALYERYGSKENVKRSIAEDPAGVLFDIATLLEGGGAALKATRLPGVARVGEVTKVAGEVINPARLGVKAVGETTAVVGRAAKGTGEAIFKSSITPNVSEAERILRFEAKAPFVKRTTNYLKGETTPGKPVLRSDTALEKGLVGRQKDIGIQASREADKLYSTKIEPAIKSSDAVVTKEDLFRPVIEKIEKTAEPGRKAALQEAFEAIQDEYKAIDSISLDQAQAIKRGLDEFTPDKMFRGQNIASEYRALKHEMADAIRQKTYQSLQDVNIRKDYLDYGNLSELERIGVKAISEAGTKGGFGGFWTTMWDTATTPVKTIGGQVLYRVGNKLEFVGVKGIKKFGDFLKMHGLERPKS